MHNYTKQFKKAVVKKVLVPGIRMRDVAQKLNISVGTLREWKKQFGRELQLEVEKDFIG